MPSRERVQSLVAQVEAGDILGAFEEFYAESISMQENLNAPTVGKDANRKREEEFVANVGDVHYVKAEAVIVDGDHAAIHWVMDITLKNGARVKYDQIALQKWEGDHIVSERFVYDTGAK